MRMGLKWSKCARPDHVGRVLPVTRSSLRRAGERRCGSNAGRDDEKREREELCYEFTIARPTILLLLVLLLFPRLSFSSLFLPRNILRSVSHFFSLFSLFLEWLFISLFHLLPRTFILHLRPSKPFCLCAIHSTRAYRIAINGFRFRCLNLCILLAFRSIRSFLHWPSLLTGSSAATSTFPFRRLGSSSCRGRYNESSGRKERFRVNNNAGRLISSQSRGRLSR